MHFLGKKRNVKCITATYRAGLSASVLLEIKAIIKLSLKEIIVLNHVTSLVWRHAIIVQHSGTRFATVNHWRRFSCHKGGGGAVERGSHCFVCSLEL